MNRKVLLLLIIFIFSILAILISSGTKKITSDLRRLIENTRPRSAQEVYITLFKQPVNGCVSIINFKDQVIPKIDCCIWMEVQMCPTELGRLKGLKEYSETQYKSIDSIFYLSQYNERPKWWRPQLLGDRIRKAFIKYSDTKQQTIFFSQDQSHAFICDLAL